MAVLPILRGLLERQRTLRELTALAVIANHPGCSLREITTQLDCPKGSAAGVVERLVLDGLVSREEDAGDARLVRLNATTAGAQEYALLHRLTLVVG